MRNYIIGILVVFSIFLGSVIFKQENKFLYLHFPIPETLKSDSSEEQPIYLFLFFSRNDCMPCVLEVIDFLETLPPGFRVAGIVPDRQLESELELRRLTSVEFQLFNFSEFKKHLPWHTPTLFGVSPSGRIVFVLPCVEGQKAYIENVVLNVYRRIYFKFAGGEN